jgi:CysZ protein
MIFEAARRALADLFSPNFRPLFFKTLGLTILGLIGLWFALDWLAEWLALPFVDDLIAQLPEWVGWLSAVVSIVVGVAIALALALLLAPSTAIVAGFFLDDVAAEVERSSYPTDAPGRALPAWTAFVISLRFFGVVILGNLLALALLLVPGVNLVAFFVVNGYLLGREFFEFAAMRFRPEAEAKMLRSRNGGTVFLAGLLIALLLAVPIVNLAAPFFAAALMVHLHKLITARGLERAARADTLRRAA